MDRRSESVGHDLLLECSDLRVNDETLRMAADAVGATKMDRPEWIAVHPRTREVVVTLTNTGGEAVTFTVEITGGTSEEHLVGAGGSKELTFADQASRYDSRCERHDHVHCSICGVLLDVDVPEALMARHVAEERSGFSISHHHTVFVGHCPACRAAERDGGREDGSRSRKSV